MSGSEVAISLVKDDPLFRLQRRFGLIPNKGLALIRRAVFFALLAWLPIAVWAVVKGRAMPGAVDEPLLQHFGIHIRFLIALSLLILGEGMAHRVTTQTIPCFLTSGLVRDKQRLAFRDACVGMVGLRNSTHPWVIIVAVIAAWTAFGPSPASDHELVWAAEGPSASLHLGFGGWWLALAFLLLKSIVGLDLALAPTHPDRADGLGFLEKFPSSFSLFAFAVSAVVASRLAHEVVYHGVHVLSLKALIGVSVAMVTVLCLAPLLVFIPKLAATKRRAILQYGTLIGEHGRLVHRRWIQREPLEDSLLLDAPELGPVADTLSLYDAVTKMRPAPIGKTALFAVVLPAVIPMLALFAIDVPIKDFLLKIVTSMV